MFRHLFEKSSPTMVYFERIAALFLVATSSMPLIALAVVTLR